MGKTTILPTITLTPTKTTTPTKTPTTKKIVETISKSKTGQKIATILDYVSAPLSQPVTTLTKGWGAGAKEVKKLRQDTTKPFPIAKHLTTVIGSTALVAGAILTVAPALGAVGATSAIGGAATGLLTSKTGILVAGLSAVSPGVMSRIATTPELAVPAAATLVNPILGLVTAGAVGTSLIGEFVGEHKKELMIAGGIAAGAVAAGAAGYGAYKLFGNGEKDATAALVTPAGSAQTLVSETSPPVVATTPQQMATTPSIRITNKPQINIAIANRNI